VVNSGAKTPKNPLSIETWGGGGRLSKQYIDT